MTVTKIDSYNHIDWLGNAVNVGNWVVYSSKSRNTGMNLGRVEQICPSQARPGAVWLIKIRVYKQSSNGWSKGRLIVLSSGESAFNSITRYFGTIPQDVE